MGFKEDMAEDIDGVFFDEDFFAIKQTFDGAEIPVIVDSYGLEELAKKSDKQTRYKDEIHKKQVLILVREADMKRKLTVNSAVEYGGSNYRVAMLSKNNGVWKILLERDKV